LWSKFYLRQNRQNFFLPLRDVSRILVIEADIHHRSSWKAALGRRN